MIGRVRDRATFEALRRRGRRVRRGPVTVVHLPVPPSAGTPSRASVAGASPAGPPVRAAFGINRKVGNAAVRNRVRRRLRAILRELDRGDEGATGGLAPGTYLVTVRPEAASLPYAELQRHVAAACAAVGDGSAARDPGARSDVAAGRRDR